MKPVKTVLVLIVLLVCVLVGCLPAGPTIQTFKCSDGSYVTTIKDDSGQLDSKKICEVGKIWNDNKKDLYVLLVDQSFETESEWTTYVKNFEVGAQTGDDYDDVGLAATTDGKHTSARSGDPDFLPSDTKVTIQTILKNGVRENPTKAFIDGLFVAAQRFGYQVGPTPTLQPTVTPRPTPDPNATPIPEVPLTDQAIQLIQDYKGAILGFIIIIACILGYFFAGNMLRKIGNAMDNRYKAHKIVIDFTSTLEEIGTAITKLDAFFARERFDELDSNAVILGQIKKARAKYDKVLTLFDKLKRRRPPFSKQDLNDAINCLGGITGEHYWGTTGEVLDKFLNMGASVGSGDEDETTAILDASISHQTQISKPSNLPRVGILDHVSAIKKEIIRQRQSS